MSDSSEAQSRCGIQDDGWAWFEELEGGDDELLDELEDGARDAGERDLFTFRV